MFWFMIGSSVRKMALSQIKTRYVSTRIRYIILKCVGLYSNTVGKHTKCKLSFVYTLYIRCSVRAALKLENTHRYFYIINTKPEDQRSPDYFPGILNHNCETRKRGKIDF